MVTFLSALLLSATPAARVDGAVITTEEVRSRQAATQAAGGNAEAAGLLQDLINEELLAREAARRGLGEAPAVVQAVAAQRRSLAARRLVDETVAAAGPVDEAQLEALFHDAEDTVTLKSIVVASEEEARAVKGRLEAGASFAEEARSSLDPVAARKGGALGTVTRGQLEAPVQPLLFAAPLGALVGPVKLSLGYGVMVVQARHLGDAAGFSASREAVQRVAGQQLARELRTHLVTQLRAKARVVLDEAFLASTGSAAAASEAQARQVVATAAGEAVTYGEVLTRLTRAFGAKAGTHVSGLSVKRELAWELVDERLLEREAAARGLERGPALETQLWPVQREALVRALAGRVREDAGAPTAAAVDAFFRAHTADYARPATRTCGIIAVKTRQQALELKARAAKGEAFEALAQEYSLDAASAARGGQLGAIDDRQLAALAQSSPALAEALRAARPGQVSDPVPTQAVWQLVRCGAVTPGAPVALGEVRAALVERMRGEQGVEALRALAAQLRAKARVAVEPGALGGGR